MVIIEKDGYVSETVTLTSGVGGAIAGNILLGGIIGGGIDMASGAAYKLYPETVNIALREGGPSVVKQQPQIKLEQDPPKVIATLSAPFYLIDIRLRRVLSSYVSNQLGSSS